MCCGILLLIIVNVCKMNKINLFKLYVWNNKINIYN